MNIKMPKILDDYLNRCAGIANALSKGNRGEFVLKMMAFEEFRAMKYPPFERIASAQFTEAFCDHDWEFFKKLGRALEQPAVNFWQMIRSDQLAGLLLCFWENGLGDSPNAARLQDCSDEVTAEVVRFISGNAAHSFDSVRKTRQRLGLPKSGQPKFTQFKRINDARFELS
jgi:hypothetical protein